MARGLSRLKALLLAFEQPQRGFELRAHLLELGLGELALEDRHRRGWHRSDATVSAGLGQLAQTLARSADGEALFVQQAADAPDHLHVVVLVIAAVAPAL